MTARSATLYRMVMDEHVCPYGLKSLDLLKRQGFVVKDRHLTTRKETDAFKKKHGVETTPQTFIDGERIGGYDDVRAFFGKARNEPKEGETSYRPVIAIFGVAFLLGLAISWYALGSLFTVQAVEWFVSLAMALLAIQKLQDIRSFSTMFLNYDLLARRWVRYGFIYPFGEALAGILMVAHAPTAYFRSGIAVYRHRRRDQCLQGRLYRQARAQMRLCRRQQ